jgi:hypothetical protein
VAWHDAASDEWSPLRARRAAEIAMDGTRNETLARSLSVAGSRRETVKAVAAASLGLGLEGTLVGLFSLTLGRDEAVARKGKRKRKKKKKAKGSGGGAPSPVTRADAACLEQSNTHVEAADGNERFAQTFTPLTSGFLVAARMTIVKDAGTTGDYLLHVATVDGAGRPTNTVLATTSIPNAAVPNGSSAPTFDFATPLAVATGATYALILTRPGSSQLTSRATAGSTCAGAAFYSNSQTGAFVPKGDTTDFAFSTFVAS